MEMVKERLGPQPLLYPMPAVLVGTIVNDTPNFMTAAWGGIAAFKPPALTVGIQPVRHTLKGIQEHGTFSVNVPSAILSLRLITAASIQGRRRISLTCSKSFMDPWNRRLSSRNARSILSAR